jgi:death-on-curing protein
VNYLTAEQVLFIHARLISETGGDHGVSELELLSCALARPQVSFDGQELNPDLFSKDAVLLESLVGNHASMDSNKRRAITSAGLFLCINGYRLTASNQESEAFTLYCAQRLVSRDQITQWFKDHAERVPPPYYKLDKLPYLGGHR